jgi:UDP-N-acetylmuramyl pentapeptide synthase
MISPDCGIFTNIGPAHDEGFSSVEDKIREKLKLFKDSQGLVYSRDHLLVHQQIEEKKQAGYFNGEMQLLSWSLQGDAPYTFRILSRDNTCKVRMLHQQHSFDFHLPFSDDSSIENCLHCLVFLFHKGMSPSRIQEELLLLQPVEMRLELKEGANDCSIINDTYNSDINSLEIALDFLNQQNQYEDKLLIYPICNKQEKICMSCMQRSTILSARKASIN